MTTTTLVAGQTSTIRRTAAIGSAIIALAVVAVLSAYPADPNLDWPDIFAESALLAADTLGHGGGAAGEGGRFTVTLPLNPPAA